MKRRIRPFRTWMAGAATACVVVLTAGCGGVTAGHAVSPLYDPFRVAGLTATDGPSGVKAGAPEPAGTVQNSDGGDLDKLALLAVNDITDYWSRNYSSSLAGTFTPVDHLESYDSDDPSSPRICGNATYQEINAFYCVKQNLMAWDRGVLVANAKKYFGDASIAALLGHEYGHAVQKMARLATRDTPVIVLEQQADCFSGSYMRWVTEGQSPRFRLATGNGLNHVLAAGITLRDPVLAPDGTEWVESGHGTALDRVSAFQKGFSSGPAECAKIDLDEVRQRRGDLPPQLPLTADAGGFDGSDVPLDAPTLTSLMEVLGTIYQPRDAPNLSLQPEDCKDARPSPPASYCPATNTISVDMPAFQQLGAVANEKSRVLIQGPNTALSVLTSRYALAVEHGRGATLDTPAAALRTACLTGLAQAAMGTPIPLADGGSLTITANDLDEAVAGLLTNGLAASNVNGETVPAGFTRIVAYRSGLSGDAALCRRRFT